MKNIYSNIHKFNKKILNKAINYLKKNDVNLEASVSDYQRLIQLNKHVDFLFKNKVKEISSLNKKK